MPESARAPRNGGLHAIIAVCFDSVLRHAEDHSRRELVVGSLCTGSTVCCDATTVGAHPLLYEHHLVQQVCRHDFMACSWRAIVPIRPDGRLCRGAARGPQCPAALRLSSWNTASRHATSRMATSPDSTCGSA